MPSLHIPTVIIWSFGWNRQLLHILKLVHPAVPMAQVQTNNFRVPQSLKRLNRLKWNAYVCFTTLNADKAIQTAKIFHWVDLSYVHIPVYVKFKEREILPLCFFLKLEILLKTVPQHLFCPVTFKYVHYSFLYLVDTLVTKQCIIMGKFIPIY